MSKVNTVLGPVDTSALGRTHMHEHLIMRHAGADVDPLLSFDEDAAAKAVTEQVLALKGKGISTIVDATPITMGRQVEFLARVAKDSNMNIVASTGFHNRRLAFPDYFAAMSADELAAIMDHEITKGIPGTHVKAGIIKVATGLEKIPWAEKRALQAAARVSRSTGVPIITHTEGTLGIEQIDIIENEGCDLSRVVIGHTCTSSDIKYYLDLLGRGVYLGFDQIGWAMFQSDDVRLVAIAGLIGAGYAHRIVLSQDAVIAQVGKLRVGLPPSEIKELTYMDDEFIPRLLKGGIPPELIEQILRDNPRHIFGG